MTTKRPFHVGRAAALAALATLLLFGLLFGASAAADEQNAQGKLIWNDQEIELPYAYVRPIEGFYEESDPAWEIIFSAEPIAERDLDEFFMEFSYVKVSITRQTDPDTGEPGELEVFSQNIRPTKLDSNVSGGAYPELALDQAGPDRFAGRVYLPEPFEFFDDTFQYDLTFSALLWDPGAPIGAPLPAGGGAPGKAYRQWVEAIHSGEIDRIKTLLSEDQQAAMAQASEKEIADAIEFMTLMTPKEIEIVGGSADGETAILQVRGTMDGAETTGEITMRLEAGRWMLEGESWK